MAHLELGERGEPSRRVRREVVERLIAPSEEDRVASAMKVERSAEVDRERQSLRKLRRLFGHVHETALGLDGQIEPCGRRELARPDPCGEHDAVGFDPPLSSLHAGDASARDNDSLHRAGLHHLRPESGRPPCAALHDEVGRDEACHRVDDGAAEIVDGELRHDVLRLLWPQHPRLDPGGDLVDEVRLEALDVAGVVQQEEVAVKPEVELLPDLFLEALQPPDRLEPDAHVQLIREERAETAGTVASRTAGERVALEEDRPSAPELGEVAHRGCTHDASAYYDNVGALGHVFMIDDG